MSTRSSRRHGLEVARAGRSARESTTEFGCSRNQGVGPSVKRAGETMGDG